MLATASNYDADAGSWADAEDIQQRARALVETASLVPSNLYMRVLDEVPTVSAQDFSPDLWDFYAGIAGVTISLVGMERRRRHAMWHALRQELEAWGEHAERAMADLLDYLRRQRQLGRVDFPSAVGVWVVQNVLGIGGTRSDFLQLVHAVGRVLASEFTPQAGVNSGSMH